MIKFVVFDFDGVFTDGKITFNKNGEIYKCYNVKDGTGINLLRENNINIGVISGYKENKSQREILKHLKIKFVSLGNNNKLKVLETWCNKLNIDLNTEVAFMGDDINDLSIMNNVTLVGCPKNANEKCLKISNFTSKYNGGNGCVRDFCNFIIHKNKKKTISGLICIKYHSSRLPFKNFRKFGNTTLLDIKIKKLLSLNFLDSVIVNTESDFIIDYISKNYTNNKIKIVKRDAIYSDDKVENKDFCINVSKNIPTEYILYSPVTMPFISAETYENMYSKIYTDSYDSIILVADGKQGCGHTYEKHNFCFGASLMKKKDVLKFGDFIGKNPYFEICNKKERIDIDYPNEFNIALYHYFNKDGIYGYENKNSLSLNSLYDLKNFSTNENSILKNNIESSKEVKINDVTIRDGGFNNKWNWDIELVKKMLKCASDSNIEYFEIGYICNKDILKKGDGHFRNVSFETIQKIVNDVKPKCKISVLFDAWRYDTNQLLPKKNTKIDLVRVVTYMEKDKLKMAIEQCKNVKNKGYEVSLNIMCASYFNNEILKIVKNEIIKNIEIFDYIYFADSYGAMEPNKVKQVFEYIQDIKSIKKVKLGFHIHNNGQIGMANMIESLKYVDIIDASYDGMGRGMGNVRLQDVFLYLYIKKNYKLNIKYFLDFCSSNLKEKEIEDIKHTLLGFLNIHPYRIKDFSNDKTLYELYISLKNLPFEKKYDYLI